MSGKPLLSVVVVTCNQMNYIFSTLDSILCQSYPNIELIVCDDASTQFDAEAVRQYIQLHNRGNITAFTVWHNAENLGTVKNINHGLQMAAGEYLKVIAGDDWFYDESVFLIQMDYLLSHEELLVTGKTQNCDACMNPIEDPQTDVSNQYLPMFYCGDSRKMAELSRRYHLCPYVTQAFCFRRRFFEEYGWFDESYFLMEDTPMLAKIIRLAIPVGYCDAFAVKHRSSVGVSSNQTVFSKRQIRYYEDVIHCIEREYAPYPEIFNAGDVRRRLKITRYRRDMCLAENRREKLQLTLKNAGALIAYIGSNPAKGWEKIKSVLRHGA